MNYQTVSGGIRNGNPDNGATFTHTFDTPGVYFLRSQVHETLQAKVTVMDCVSCVAVAGYDGADLTTLALALSSRAAGEFVLAVSAAGMQRVMTFITVFEGQTLTLIGTELSSPGQMAMLDATITVRTGATLVVNSTHVSGGISLQQGASLEENTAQVPAMIAAPPAPPPPLTPAGGLAVPEIQPTPPMTAAVAAVDEGADSVALPEGNSSIAAGCAHAFLPCGYPFLPSPDKFAGLTGKSSASPTPTAKPAPPSPRILT